MKSPSTEQLTSLEFHGNSLQYFALWWVNALFLVLTLGLYYPWAKVRTTRYRFSSIALQGVHFDYHAEPKQLFKGFAVAYVLFAAFVLSQVFVPLFAPVLFLVVLLALPWLVVASMRFKALMTSYRGIRFSSALKTGATYRQALLAALIHVVTFGLALPWLHWRLKLWIFNHLNYGNQRFESAGTFRPMAKLLLITVGWLVGLLALWAVGAQYIVGSLLDPSMTDLGNDQDAGQLLLPMTFLLIGGAGVIGFLVVALLVVPAYQTLVANTLWNKATVGPVQFASNLRWGAMAWLLFKNSVLTSLTFGLYFPIAQLQLLRLRVECLSAKMPDDLEAFLASERQKQGTLGEASADLVEVDFAL